MTKGRFCRFSKTGDEAALHLRGVGTFAVPQGIQDGLNAADDEWLLEHLDVSGFIDPFVLGEVMHRGLYAEAERRRIAKLEAQTGPKPTLGEWLLKSLGVDVTQVQP
jgi:hypothetical protein